MAAMQEAPQDIVPGDVWTLIPSDGLGVGSFAIPAGAQVTVREVLEPFSPGIAPVDEYSVRAEYVFPDFSYDGSGNLVAASNVRVLAYAESIFRSLFSPGGTA
jgi:hypothetical protein